MFSNRGKALTFDDILLIPAYSEVTPDAVDISTWLTPSIPLRIPLLSAAMDTVTESAMAISMARMGGIGIIHKNMSIEHQRLEIERVKKSESGMILDPVTIKPFNTVQQALDLMSNYRVSGLPVVDGDKLVGIITNRDVRFVEDAANTKVSDVMTSERLITVPVGTSLEESKRHLHEYRIEKLLVVDDNNRLVGLITMKDIDKVQKYPNACKDSKGRLRVGAAIGIGKQGIARAEQLLAAGADVLVLDSAHGHSINVLNSIREIRACFPDCQLVAGNVATYEGAKAVLEAGADTVKIGIGPGSICTTRIVAGVGGNGGKPRRNHSLPGQNLQDLSRHGFHRCHERRKFRPLFPGKNPQACAGRHCRACAVPRRCHGCGLSADGRLEIGHGLSWRQNSERFVREQRILRNFRCRVA